MKVKNYVQPTVLLGCLLTLITYGLNVAIVARVIDDEWRGLERESGRLSFQIRKRLEVLDRSLSHIAIKVGEIKAG